jgi:hypothetical protein
MGSCHSGVFVAMAPRKQKGDLQAERLVSSSRKSRSKPRFQKGESLEMSASKLLAACFACLGAFV